MSQVVRQNATDGHISPAPRVAIVVPAFNRAALVAATLASIVRQTFDDWQLVVVDDGSTDGTVSEVERFVSADRRIALLSGPNTGVASARNRGLEATDPRSEFIALLDSDDVWEPDALEELIRVLEADSELTAAHSTARSIDLNGDPLPGDNLAEVSRRRRGIRDSRLVEIAPDEPSTFSELIVHNWVLTPGTCLIRRRILDRVGPLDPETEPADDWDLVIRISRFGNIGFVDRPLLGWRRHDATLTNTSPRWRQAYFRTRDKALADPDNTAEQRLMARRAYRMDVNGELQAIGRMVRAGRVRQAIRHTVKAAYVCARYLCAEVRATTLWRRAVRGPV